MEFHETQISGVFEVRPQPYHDDRGHFARTFCQQEFRAAGLELPLAQMAISHNNQIATLRGLHYIPTDYGEAKLVRCVRGQIFDVAVDLRKGSASFGQWCGIELSAENLKGLFIPKGVAHGFITMSDNADVAYQFSEPYRPGIEQGIAWNDQELAIEWPIEPRLISERDKALPTLDQAGLEP